MGLRCLRPSRNVVGFIVAIGIRTHLPWIGFLAPVAKMIHSENAPRTSTVMSPPALPRRGAASGPRAQGRRIVVGNFGVVVFLHGASRIGLVGLIAVLVAGCKGEPSAHGADLARADSDSELSTPVPIFNVSNLRNAQGYFHDVMGFKKEWDDGNPVDFAAAVRGHTRIFLCEGCSFVHTAHGIARYVRSS